MQRRRFWTVKRKQALAGWLFVGPALLYFAIFAFYPVGSAVYASFLRYNLLSLAPPEFSGFRNYLTLFQSQTFWNAVRATTVFTLGAFIPLVVISLLLAVLIASRKKFQRHLQVAVFTPVVVPGVVGALIWLMIFDPRGIANQWANVVLGTQGTDWRWLSSPNMAQVSSIIVYFWGYVGFFTIIFIAGLGAIPKQLSEAARIDGATSWQSFWYVTFPLLRPTTLLVSVMAMIFCMRTFSVQYVFAQSGAPRRPLNVVTLFIYNTAMRDHNMGMASAMSILLLLVMLVLAWLQLRTQRST